MSFLTGITVLRPSFPPLNCNTTSTLLPGGTVTFPSKAFRNFGSIKDAVANDPTCKNSFRLNNMILIFTGLISYQSLTYDCVATVKYQLQTIPYPLLQHSWYSGVLINSMRALLIYTS